MKKEADWYDKKEFILIELAKLEKLPWAKDDQVAGTVFPYVLIEAINLLLNSYPVEELKDYTKTSDEVERLLDRLLRGKS